MSDAGADVVHVDPEAECKGQGWTATGLQVELVPWDDDRVVRVESEYDAWPEVFERRSPT